MNPHSFFYLSLVIGLQAVPAIAAGAAFAVSTAWTSEGLPPGVMARLGPVRHVNYGRVMSLAFSSDGRRLAAGCWDGSVWVSDAAGARNLRQWKWHDGKVRAVAFTPDGRVLASASPNGDVRLWDTNEGRLLKSFHPGNWIMNVCFSPDGKVLAARSAKSLKLWDWAEGTLRYAVDGLAADGYFVRPTDPAFSPDSKTVAVVSHNKLHVVDVPAATVKSTALADGSWQVLSPAGSYMARIDYRRDGASQHLFEVWDLAAKRRRWLAPLAWSLDCLVFCNDDRFVALSDGSKITLFELETGKMCKQFASADKGEVCMAWSPDGKVLATGSVDQSVLLWDLTGHMPKGKWESTHPSERDLVGVWNDLADLGGQRPYDAMWQLVAGAEYSVQFLRDRLKPIAVVGDTAKIQQWIADLNSETFAVRQAAAKELEKIGDQVKAPIKEALKRNVSLETRRRLEQILNPLSDVPGSKRMRTLRAIMALERIGSPDAKRVLEALAGGAPGARETEDAKASLSRLNHLQKGL